MKLTTEEITNIHSTLRANGFPCTESGAYRFLLARGLTREQLKGKDHMGLYRKIHETH